MIILDTDVVSNLMRPRPSAALLTRLRAVPADEQSTTAVTIGELAYGAHRVGRPELYERAAQLLSGTHIVPFDELSGEVYGRVRSDLERQGRRLSDPDLRIAAIALGCGAKLVTGNARHFQWIADLDIEDWLTD